MSKNWKPKKLRFEIGAYETDSFLIEWKENGLALKEGNSHAFFGLDEVVVPDKEAWNNFWIEMEQIRVWEWSPDYSAYVLDGTSWSLTLSYENRAIETHGHMAFPDPKDLSKKVDIEKSPLFRKLIKSLNKLAGKRFITY